MNEPFLVECAKWLYDHRQQADWWTPYVLTEHNRDQSNPSVNIDQAYEVSIELRRRRLIGHTIVPGDNTAFPAFKMLENKEAEWQCLMRKAGFWELRGIPFLKWFGSKVWLVVVFTLATLATFYLNYYAAKLVKWKPEYNIRLNAHQFDKLLRASGPQGQVGKQRAGAEAEDRMVQP